MRVIADDLWFPEGTVWMGDGSLLVVEIRRRTLTQVWLDGRKRIVAELGGGMTGVIDDVAFARAPGLRLYPLVLTALPVAQRCALRAADAS